MTKILLADDEQNIRTLGEKLLKEAGYNVITAINGKEAIEKAIAEKPDLVITDIRMPEKTGFEVCKVLRSDPVLSDVPIMILSALGDEYNKITGFEVGADDYITKPFHANELKIRIDSLLARYKYSPKTSKPTAQVRGESAVSLDKITSGTPKLDKILFGGLPKGSNILLIGSLGKGKSTFCRRFISSGLENNEKCLYIAIDDDPNMIRKGLSQNMNAQEKNNSFRFVDAYSWSSGQKADEKFAIQGVLDLNQLAGLISDAGTEIGQSVQKKSGGRRIIDSISSLLVNFELPAVQKFLSQVSRTAFAFGGVTTLFVLEEGSVSDQVLNNIKYLMDGIIEFREDDNKRKLRVANMKWIQYEKDWIEWQ